MAVGGDDDAERPGGGRTLDPARERSHRDETGGDVDPPGDPDQPVETVVRYETEGERRERLHEERRHRRHRRVTEAGVALAALFVSLAVFLVNGAMFLRGSVIAVLDPDTVMFYRDEGPNGASLWVAVPARIINAAAADYGDVVTEATASIGPRRQERGRFRYMAIVEGSMTADVPKAIAECPVGARCIANTGFYVLERPRRLLDVPGGSSRSEHLAFQIEDLTCDGEPAFCEAFTGFDAALAHLRSRTDPVIWMNLSFHFDGEERVRCRLPGDAAKRTAVFDYIEKKGWAQVECEPEEQPRARTGRRN